jgi:hypothetical protein
MTITETLAAISKLRHDAREIGAALHLHAAVASDPKLHGKLHRLHGVVRDFHLAMPAVAP